MFFGNQLTLLSEAPLYFIKIKLIECHITVLAFYPYSFHSAIRLVWGQVLFLESLGKYPLGKFLTKMEKEEKWSVISKFQFHKEKLNTLQLHFLKAVK